MKKKPWKSAKGAWIGKVEVLGDIVEFDTSHLWDTLRKDLLDTHIVIRWRADPKRLFAGSDANSQ